MTDNTVKLTKKQKEMSRPLEKVLHSRLSFKRGKKKYIFNVVHNLEEFKLSIDSALFNWSARTEEWTLQSFCEYVSSKDPNILCVPKQEWDKNK